MGDTKAHTWNNGIIQTGYAYPNGTPFDDSAFNGKTGQTADGQVCVEFIGLIPLNGLGSYEIVKIIFYE